MKYILVLILVLSLNAEMLRNRKDSNKEQIVQQIKDAVKQEQSPLYHSAYKRLAFYVDTFGPRMWGSESMAEAVDALYEDLTQIGFDTVSKENIGPITSWSRGEESLTLYEPRQVPTKLNMIGLGWTPAGDVTAEVEVVHSFEELRTKDVAGKIVCFNFAWTNYDETIKFRIMGPHYAEQAGAIGTLVRSVASVSISSPHTGITYFDKLKHPAAAITVEDADMFDRMRKRGQKIIVNLKIGGQQYLTTSDNVIAEIKGSKYPDEILLMGGHWDSWDTGSQTGASDDGGGVMVCLEALRVLKHLNLKPKRTIRFIAWSGEEMGMPNNGASYYAKNHSHEKHVLAFESDHGTTKPYGFGINAGMKFTQLVTYIAQEYLTGVGAERMYPNKGEEADSQALRDITGVPVLSNMIKDTESNDFYFTYHHTAGDSMLMMNADDLDDNVVAIASLMYLIADINEAIPQD